VTDQIKQALAALEHLRRSLHPLSDGQASSYFTLKACLESAAEEQACWEAIGEWEQSSRWHNVTLYLDGDGVGYYMRLVRRDAYYNPTERSFDSETRLEALKLAADWCRGQK
jgi:hypothetical protein